MGLVSAGAEESYVELPATGMHLQDAPPNIIEQVVSQFGRVHGARVNDRIEMSDRVSTFLRSFQGTLALLYDRKADMSHLQTLIGQDRALVGRVCGYDISKETSGTASKLAWSAQLEDCAARRIGAHHALAEALALKAAWLAKLE